MKRSLRLLSLLAALGLSAALLYAGGPSGCSTNCGNGVLDEGEACDDNNKTDGDGCDSSCELESSGTTGGGTTGGTTTGGTGGTTCTTASDCDASFSGPAVCDEPTDCQGHRVEAVCQDGVCGSVDIDDDSGCTAESFTLDCSPNPNAGCDGTVAQVTPACSSEDVCNDTSDNDGDTLVDCDDADCDGQVCAAAGSACEAGLCAETTCNDSTDNDGDALTDCADTVDCPNGTPCSGGGICSSGFCND